MEILAKTGLKGFGIQNQ